MTIKFIICNKCNDAVFSFSRHSMNWCICGACALDGGFDYQKITGNMENWISMEGEISDNIEHIRKKFTWTKNYDKYERRITPVTKTLNKLTTDHIIGILLYFTKKLENNTEGADYSIVSKQWILSHQIFLEELKYRQNKKLK
jgi:hypothetical protein